MRAAGFAMMLAACGGGGSGAPPAPAAHAVSIVAPPAGPEDLEVARVDGRPVWGSCVTAQMARGAKTRAAALDECIAFELMAQAAERRGLTADPEVAEATRSAMANRLIEVGFEDKYKTPADLGDVMTKWLADNAWRMHRPELRASTYARIEVESGAPHEIDERAKALAEQIAAQLAAETGLFGVNLRETAERLAKGTGLKLDVADQKQTAKSQLEANYAGALFAIPEVGRISPVTRTKWGWDVIAWTGGLPAKEFTRDELAADVFQELRRTQLQVWINRLIKQLGIHVEVDQDQLARAEDAS